MTTGNNGPTTPQRAASSDENRDSRPMLSAANRRQHKRQRLLNLLDRAQQRWRPSAFAVAVLKKYSDDRGGYLAAVVAYYAFFSVFPALLLLVAGTGFLLDRRPDLRQDIVETALGQFPVIGDSITNQSLEGSGLALIVGAVVTLWAGLGAIVAAQHGLNEVWDVPRQDRLNLFAARLRGLLMLVVFGLGLTSATILANLLTHLSISPLAQFGIAAANLLIDIGVVWLAFQLLTQKLLRWLALLPGAILAGIGYFVLQSTGSLLIDRYVTNASDIYGTFAIVIGLLAWFHLLAQITLIAAEVNVVRIQQLYPRPLFSQNTR